MSASGLASSTTASASFSTSSGPRSRYIVPMRNVDASASRTDRLVVLVKPLDR